MIAALALAGASLAGLALATTLVNLVGWPRGRAGGTWPGRVSVLIPARDEAENIEACVRAVAASRHPVHEIVVYDDGSTDGTGAILAGLSREIPHLRVVPGRGLPPGWVGKPHACHRLAEAAEGDLLFFLDADVRLAPDGLGRVASLFEDHDAAVVTAVPRQETGSFAEHLVMPLLHLTYTSWLPLFLVHRTTDPRLLAANGQVLAVRRRVYDALGGFRAVRRAVVDDMAFCRRAKERGHTVVFADGTRIASCRMYRSFGELWQGFSKNLYEGLGGRPAALLGVMALYALAFVAPWVALGAAGLGVRGVAGAAVAGVGANLAQRALLAARHGHRWWSGLLQPLAVVVLLGIAANSWRWSRRGAIRWRGRVYAALGERHG